MPGHSPEIGLPFDLDLARRLLVEAGFAQGHGFPSLKLSYPYDFFEDTVGEIARQWQEHLGITMQVEKVDESYWTFEQFPEIFVAPWVPDYPDGMMRTLPLYDELQRGGWRNARFGTLVADAARTSDRARRMAMYREADRIWVAEEAVICPLSYNWDYFVYAKPWVKGLTISPLGHIVFKDITIEPH